MFGERKSKMQLILILGEDFSQNAADWQKEPVCGESHTRKRRGEKTGMLIDGHLERD
jgi:hypothetical protein